MYADYTPPSGSGSDLYKPVDGAQVQMRIMSDPVVFDSTFQGAGNEEAKTSTKYAMIVYNHEAKESQILVLPKRTFTNLLDYFKDPDYGDPLKNDYELKLKRTGKGTDTVWTITPAKNMMDISQDDIDDAKSVDLVKAINNFPSNSNVEYLRDVIANGKRGMSVQQKTDNFNIDVDEPISLDDIPFGN